MEVVNYPNKNYKMLVIMSPLCSFIKKIEQNKTYKWIESVELKTEF
jgi:hypothetical protein